jgi:hypothetical protein
MSTAQRLKAALSLGELPCGNSPCLSFGLDFIMARYAAQKPLVFGLGRIFAKAKILQLLLAPMFVTFYR